MNPAAAIVVLVLMLFCPLAIHWIERNIEIYILVIGVIATILAGGFERTVVEHALTEPILITLAVIIAAIAFSYLREYLERIFARLRRRMARAILAGISIFLLAMASSIITAIVAAIVLVEIVRLLHLEGAARVRVTVAACFAIGMGAAMTPIGEPLATLAASALKLPFLGLFDLLAPWIIPGALAASILGGIFARGDYLEATTQSAVRESPLAALMQGLRVYGFVAGLVLVSHAYAPLAVEIVARLSNDALFWANTVSAALDNATLVALEVHNMTLVRAREAILALLISGGMLIPGNIPNIISAVPLKIGSVAWARIGIPIGLIGLGIYFALLKFAV
jgi:predicted cation transporter